jgi:sugar lactone lactonase YvrE
VTVRFPSGYVGAYFFADFCGGRIRRYDPATGTASGFATGFGSVVDLEVSKDGELYYLSRGSPGLVGKIGYAAGT